MFNIAESSTIPGLKIIVSPYLKDDRGFFKKTFNHELFINSNIDFPIKEQYYSFSKKNVIRGLHFQQKPKDHSKMVFCIKGTVVDICVDLRSGPTYGNVHEQILDEKNDCYLYIPNGIAHGFKVITEDALMVYNVSSVYNKDFDTGILWNSISYDWDISNPIVSTRDSGFIDFQAFRTLF